LPSPLVAGEVESSGLFSEIAAQREGRRTSNLFCGGIPRIIKTMAALDVGLLARRPTNKILFDGASLVQDSDAFPC
jgi:hypothetical protein